MSQDFNKYKLKAAQKWKNILSEWYSFDSCFVFKKSKENTVSVPFKDVYISHTFYYETYEPEMVYTKLIFWAMFLTEQQIEFNILLTNSCQISFQHFLGKLYLEELLSYQHCNELLFCLIIV